MNTKDERSGVLESERKKWEFRYENQDKRIKELEKTIKTQRATIRRLHTEEDKLEAKIDGLEDIVHKQEETCDE